MKQKTLTKSGHASGRSQNHDASIRRCSRVSIIRSGVPLVRFLGNNRVGPDIPIDVQLADWCGRRLKTAGWTESIPARELGSVDTGTLHVMSCNTVLPC